MDLTLTTALLWLAMQATTAASTSQPAAAATAPAATTRPVAAVWSQTSRPMPPDGESRRLIVGVWGDGTVVWSADRATGGKPYRAGRIEVQRVEQLLAQLKAAAFFEEKRKYNFGPDASHTVLAAEGGGQHQQLGSWHEPAWDSNGRSVVTELGVVAVAPGEKPPEPSPEYRKYLDVWAKSRRVIEAVIPQEGQPLKTLDARVFDLGRPPRGEKK